jgi:hypothetical protein
MLLKDSQPPEVSPSACRAQANSEALYYHDNTRMADVGKPRIMSARGSCQNMSLAIAPDS